jgi:predicted NUDIX family NTP pyrophosphohydrolase
VKHAAGLLMYRRGPGGLEVLLAHPGGPYWSRKDEGAWTLPKGELAEGEAPLDGAIREFTEETGFTPAPPYLPLGDVKLKSGKRVAAWAFEGDFDPRALVCNTFELEWPPRSGRMRSFPEIDRAAWFDLPAARTKLLAAQLPFLDRLAALVAT